MPGTILFAQENVLDFAIVGAWNPVGFEKHHARRANAEPGLNGFNDLESQLLPKFRRSLIAHHCKEIHLFSLQSPTVNADRSRKAYFWNGIHNLLQFLRSKG